MKPGATTLPSPVVDPSLTQERVEKLIYDKIKETREKIDKKWRELERKNSQNCSKHYYSDSAYDRCQDRQDALVEKEITPFREQLWREANLFIEDIKNKFRKNEEAKNQALFLSLQNKKASAQELIELQQQKDRMLQQRTASEQSLLKQISDIKEEVRQEKARIAAADEKANDAILNLTKTVSVPIEGCPCSISGAQDKKFSWGVTLLAAGALFLFMRSKW